jgi:hypothetical protein
MPLTRLELEQIKNLRQYDDNLPAGSGLKSGPTLDKDLQAVLSQLNKIIGKSNWYESPDISLSQVSASGAIAPAGREKYITIATINAGDQITIPNGTQYTLDSQFRNLQVFRNGFLLLPGSGITQNDSDFGDYRELNNTTIVSNDRIRKNEILQFIIFQ